jgi:hypothetical protein
MRTASSRRTGLTDLGLRRLWGVRALEDRTAGTGADENFDPVSGAAGENHQEIFEETFVIAKSAW